MCIRRPLCPNCITSYIRDAIAALFFHYSKIQLTDMSTVYPCLDNGYIVHLTKNNFVRMPGNDCVHSFQERQQFSILLFYNISILHVSADMHQEDYHIHFAFFLQPTGSLDTGCIYRMHKSQSLYIFRTRFMCRISRCQPYESHPHRSSILQIQSHNPVRFSPLQRISPIRYNIGCHKIHIYLRRIRQIG